MADVQAPIVLGSGLRPGPAQPVPSYAVGAVEVAVPGPPGSAAGVTAVQDSLDAHVAAQRPHQAAESGYDAAGYFLALTT